MTQLIHITVECENTRVALTLGWSEQLGEFAGLVDADSSITATGETIGEVIDRLLAQESIAHQFAELAAWHPDEPLPSTRPQPNRERLPQADGPTGDGGREATGGVAGIHHTAG